MPWASGMTFLVERESWRKEEWTSLVIVQRETGRGIGENKDEKVACE